MSENQSPSSSKISAMIHQEPSLAGLKLESRCFLHAKNDVVMQFFETANTTIMQAAGSPECLPRGRGYDVHSIAGMLEDVSRFMIFGYKHDLNRSR